ncbi:hypothetical protein NE237_001492 [Protea cynaroides]|uniref:Uncharacterized protein n=1 Tax=Protea cynaroides TaxID=273540 RepID=A0A9Q0KU94_9MAGN|nr:hypothetical protein NE237_001492 [Protea cynaroides]
MSKVGAGQAEDLFEPRTSNDHDYLSLDENLHIQRNPPSSGPEVRSSCLIMHIPGKPKTPVNPKVGVLSSFEVLANLLDNFEPNPAHHSSPMATWSVAPSPPTNLLTLSPYLSLIPSSGPIGLPETYFPPSTYPLSTFSVIDEAIQPENLNTVENRLDELQTSSPEDPSFPRLDSLTYLLAKRQTIHILEASGHKAL